MKAGIETMLGAMADQGKGEATIRRVFMLVHELFVEAVENNYVMKKASADFPAMPHHVRDAL